MDRAELDKRIEEEAEFAIKRADNAKPGVGVTLRRAAAFDVVRPLVERIVELEESAAGLVRARIEALTADLDACREIIETRSNALRAAEEGRVLLNAEIDRLEQQLAAAAEHSATAVERAVTLAQETIALHEALEDAARRLKEQTERAETFKGGVRGLCLQIVEMERQMEKAGQS